MENKKTCSECWRTVPGDHDLCVPCAKRLEERDEKYRCENPEGADTSNTIRVGF